MSEEAKEPKAGEAKEKSTKKPKAPRVTSKTIVSELRAAGYTGPVSYGKSKLQSLLDEVKAGTYTGKGAPGTE